MPLYAECLSCEWTGDFSKILVDFDQEDMMVLKCPYCESESVVETEPPKPDQCNTQQIESEN